jgi:sugar O-acyltransferase (sialic acid O-acetyltransferase NeuD family)
MKPSIILIGSGGHCKSCIDIIEQENEYSIAGIIDKNRSTKSVLGYSILGNDADLIELKTFYDYALITIGQIESPDIRIQLFNHLKLLGFKLPTIASSRAYISKHAQLGEGTIVMHDALINASAVIGNNCIINTKALIEHDVVIEDNCHISTGAVINGGTILKNGTFIGSNAVTKEYVQTKAGEFIKAGSLFKGYVSE